jgi:signal transduction histidine kinase
MAAVASRCGTGDAHQPMPRFLRSKSFHALSAVIGLLGLPLVILLTLQWRAVADFELSTTAMLQQMNAHTAESLAQQIQRDFKAPTFNLLEQVDHNDVREMRLDAIAETLRAAAPHASFLDLFFVWSNEGPVRSRDPAEDVRFARLSTAHTPVGQTGAAVSSPAFFSDPALAATIFREARDFAAIRSNFALADQKLGDLRQEMVYHFLYTLPERRRLNAFLGFSIDRQRLYDRYFPDAIERLGAAMRQLRGFPLIQISIVDDQGQEVYRTGPTLLNRFDHEVEFPFFFYDIDLVASLNPFKPAIRYWKVRTGFGTTSIPAAVRAATFPQRLLWVAVGAFALGGLFLTIRATVRELRLARMKSDFVSSVSHELKTPLALIQLFADTLEGGRVASNDKAREYYRIIGAEARKLTRQLGDLIEFGRIETGSREYPIQQVDLCDVIRTTVATYRPQLEDQRFEVEMALPDGEILVRGDPEGLQRIVSNLVSNAIKYSNGHPYLRVALSRDAGDAVIEVTDQGLGIAPTAHTRIFQPFERAVGGGATGVPGSGLGLAIVAHAVKAHGGRIDVISSPGRGSTFRVRLPGGDPPQGLAT